MSSRSLKSAKYGNARAFSGYALIPNTNARAATEHFQKWARQYLGAST
ncbi:hypothetical protein FHS76_003826 [Ochrobactrum daejeonense]|uniref:Uncharacterized protein n=1 Tax=Brucella daejeonensis TaxID=659015 RepID=A0A7W9B0R7_9HYPH|nr:hypothetical protein [Brucella daejeonensis]